MRKLLLCCFIISIVGCAKEINSNPANAIRNGAQNNAVVVDTYLPLTKGTIWNYTNETNSKVKKSKLTVTRSKRTINGKNYTAIKSVTKGVPDTIYYNHTGHDYYLYTKQGSSDADAVNLEILFLKDDAAAGTTWSQPAGSGNGVSLSCSGKIMETGISLTVSGVTYTDVIHTYIEVKTTGFFSIVVYKQDYYVAKNIGVIKNLSTQVVPSGPTTTTELASYTIQ